MTSLRCFLPRLPVADFSQARVFRGRDALRDTPRVVDGWRLPFSPVPLPSIKHIPMGGRLRVIISLPPAVYASWSWDHLLLTVWFPVSSSGLDSLDATIVSLFVSRFLRGTESWSGVSGLPISAPKLQRKRSLHAVFVPPNGQPFSSDRPPFGTLTASGQSFSPVQARVSAPYFAFPSYLC